jgi:hypothetical protein
MTRITCKKKLGTKTGPNKRRGGRPKVWFTVKLALAFKRSEKIPLSNGAVLVFMLSTGLVLYYLAPML